MDAYFPGVSAIHILLDYFIDQAEDREHGELNFMACYPSPAAPPFRGSAGLVAHARARAHAGRRDAPRLLTAGDVRLLFDASPQVFEQHLDRDSVAHRAALTSDHA